MATRNSSLPHWGKYFSQPRFVLILLGTALWIVYSIWYLATIPTVPFHPDESTQIFMSSDFQLFIKSPALLFWEPEKVTDARQRYHELDSPFTRYWIGFFRALFRAEPLNTDWDWGITWDQNNQAGALPEPGLLQTARFSISIFGPLSIICIFLIGRKVHSSLFGFLCALLLAFNPLFLLHTRRAMAEGPLLFWILLTILVLLYFKSKYWLCAVTSALAFISKQSAVLLLPLCVIFYLFFSHPLAIKSIVQKSISFLLIFLSICFFLNPFLWHHPIQAFESAVNARQELTKAQAEGIQSIAPEKISTTTSEKLSWLFVNTFMSDPAIADVGNYQAETAAAEHDYFANPVNNLFRGILGGGIQAGIFLIGVLAAIFYGPINKRYALIFAAGLLIFSLGQFASPLPFQRYILPILPFTVFFTALGLLFLIGPIRRLMQKRATA